MGDYGHASHSVWIADGLGVTDTELAALRAAVPWWRAGYEGLLIVGLALIGTFSIAAGGLTYRSRGRARPVAPELRVPLAVGVGLLALGMLAASGFVLGQSPDHAWLFPLAPPPLISVVALVWWQWQLTGTGARLGARRWVPAIGAAGVVAVYTTVALFIFMLQSGFWD